MILQNDNYLIAVEGGAITALQGQDGHVFAKGAAVPLWEVTLRHRDGHKAAFASTDFPQEEPQEGRLSWTPSADGTGCRVDVRITPDGDKLTAWTIAVTGVPADWTVFSVKFPCFDWQLEQSDRYRMILPADRGLDIANPLVNLPDNTELYIRRQFRKRKYPNCFLAMQCFGFINDNHLFYFAAHDPVPAVKSLYFSPDADANVIRMRPGVDTGFRYGEDYVSFPWAFGFTVGDWFDVATFYRRFALTASWTQGGPLEESDKTPRWYQDTPMVMLKDYRGELYDADAFIKVAEYLQVPLLLHYYLWHQAAFDTDYPFLFPAIPEFRAEMKKLQAAGVRVMPYFNTYSADTGMEGWNEIEPLAIRKNEEMELHSQVWSQNRALACMCPWSTLWKRILNLISMRAVEMGVDGLYFDEIGCSPAHNCYAENHGHVPGDEGAFVAGHRAVLRELRREARSVNPDIITTTESNAEAYLDVIDGYLNGNGNDPNEVPIFEAVYHDYVLSFGQYIFSNELDMPTCHDAIIGKCARQFIVGAQFGWSRIPLLAIMEKRPDCASFIKTLAHARLHNADFLARGRMLRPLHLDVPTVTQRWLRTWDDKTGTEMVLPAVLNSVWTRNDASLGVVLVNIGEEPVETTIALGDHPEDYPLPQAGIVRVWEQDGAERRGLIPDGDSDRFTVIVKPRTCLVASLGSEKPYGVHRPPL